MAMTRSRQARSSTKAPRLPSLLVSLFLLAPSALAVQPDFSFYPSGSQSCLNKAAEKADCKDAATFTVLNTCLCGGDSGFAINTATCLGKEDSDNVKKVYSTMNSACLDTDTPMDTSQKEFYAAANGDAPTSTKTTSPSPTATSTNKPTQTSDDNDGDGDGGNGGLSTGAIAGIGAGAGVAGAAIVAAVAFYIFRRRRNRSEESHPMLGHGRHDSKNFGQNGPTTFPPSEPSPGLGNGFYESKPVYSSSGLAAENSPRMTNATTTPSDRNSAYPPSNTNSWGSPPQAWVAQQQMQNLHGQYEPYAGPYAAPPASLPNVAELPPQTAPQPPPVIYEMDAASKPTELSDNLRQ